MVLFLPNFISINKIQKILIFLNINNLQYINDI